MTLFDPATTAIVAIDLQNANMASHHEPLSSREVLDASVRLFDAARRAGSLVIHVRTSFLPNEQDSLAPLIIEKMRSMTPVREAGWDELAPECAPTPIEPILKKRSWNAFHGTELDLELRRHGVKTIVMVGMSTNFGVEGTARAAYEHYYNIVFADGAMSAGTTLGHDHAIREIFPQLGLVRSVGEIEAAFSA